MRVPTDVIQVTPHGAFGFRRRTKRDGACGWQGKYPCVHQGVDLAGAAGAAVYAPERCTVVVAAFDNKTGGLRGFGPGALKLRGASGAVHTLGHLSPTWWSETVWQLPGSPFEGFRGKPRIPHEGRVYREGEQLGVIARNHVHWEVSIRGAKVDPLRWATGELGPAPTRGWGVLLLILLALAASNRS